MSNEDGTWEKMEQLPLEEENIGEHNDEGLWQIEDIVYLTLTDESIAIQRIFNIKNELVKLEKKIKRVHKIKESYFINVYKHFNEKYYTKYNKEKFFKYVLPDHNKMDRKVGCDNYNTSGGTYSIIFKYHY